MTCIIVGKHGYALEGMWVLRAMQRDPMYILQNEAELFKKFVRNKIRECQNTLTSNCLFSILKLFSVWFFMHIWSSTFVDFYRGGEKINEKDDICDLACSSDFFIYVNFVPTKHLNSWLMKDIKTF